MLCEALEERIAKQKAERALPGGNGRSGANGRWNDSIHGRAPHYAPDYAPAEDEQSTGLGEWNAALDIDPPPPRGWLLGNTFCRKFLSSLIGAGGSGKTALRYAQALALATGRSDITGEQVFERCRVLIVSLEDDADELRRRIRVSTPKSTKWSCGLRTLRPSTTSRSTGRTMYTRAKLSPAMPMPAVAQVR
jgi:hypothetical protein